MSYQTLEQNIIPSISPTLYVYSHHISDAGRVAKIIRDRGRPTVGLAVQLSNRGHLDAIVLSTGPYVHYISCDEYAEEDSFFFSKLLNSQFGTVVGFNMARLALHIYRTLGVNSSGVDLSTVHPNCRERPWNPSELVLRKLYPQLDKYKLDALWYGQNGDTASRDACLRAWISAKVSEYALPEIRSAKKVTTHLLEYKTLDCLGRLVTTMELLDAAKPTLRDNEFESVEMADGQLVLQNSRFKTRVRRSNQTSVLLSSNRGGDVVGRAIHAHGRSTNIQVLEGNFRGGVKRVRIVGREEATFPEVARDLFLLQLLRGEINIRNRPFIDMLWFSSRGPPIVPIKTEIAEDHPSFAMLNISQCAVAAAMITPTEPLVIAHGPPGTGKTTTIAAAVNYWSVQNATVWIVARSNVAVRNIARSLLSNEVSDFKLLVSKEFYLEWHEDLYARLQKHLIRSDDLFNDSVTFERRFNGSRVVLCTLSMLSNPALDEIGVFDLLPVERLVVDEASQIDTFEFMHLFHKFKRLRKVCLFGDPQQLPPFGQDIAPQMKSIFDIKHLQPNAYFLSTQYRLPIPLGDFISDQVYKSELHSEHWNESMACVRLVDVLRSEEAQSGSSFLNRDEINTVVHLIRHYYRERDFCVITPYDAQRAAIQKRLQTELLPHDRVFNVDSFQGHEAAYVIVSAVRTKAPGFLRFKNRMNVMLTRCEAGMVIVTNKRFIQTCAKDTLLGNLARHWEIHSEKAWVDSREVANQTAEMPGVSSSRQKSLTYLPVQEPSSSIISRTPSQPLSISHRNSNGSYRDHDVQGLSPGTAQASSSTQERLLNPPRSSKAVIPPYECASLTSRQVSVTSGRAEKVNTTHKENMAHPFRGDRYVPHYY